MNARELQATAHRNRHEFAWEGWDWQTVLEDEHMMVDVSTGQKHHPCWFSTATNDKKEVDNVNGSLVAAATEAAAGARDDDDEFDDEEIVVDDDADEDYEEEDDEEYLEIDEAPVLERNNSLVFPSEKMGISQL